MGDAADAMQVDPGHGHGLVSLATKATVEVAVHPLVLVNMSDHISKLRIQHKTSSPAVYGALLGTHEGRHVVVVSSCELIATTDQDGAVKIDIQYLEKRLEFVSQVMAGLELVGWYATGAQPTPTDISIQRQMMQAADSPLFLQLDTALTGERSQIEMPKLYESITEEVQGQPQLVFVPVPYKVETEETEHIAISHIAKVASRDGDGGAAAGRSLVSTQLMNQYNAAQMLHQRTRVIRDYVLAVQKGEIAPNHEILRDIASLCHRLPLVSHDDFRRSFMTEYNDVILSVLLAGMTTGCEKIEDLTYKVNLLYSDKGQSMGHHRTFIF